MVLRQKNPGKKNDDGTINSDVKLSMDYFIKHARKKNTGKSETIKDIKNKYKTDFAYGSTNEKVTDVIKAEREVKKMQKQQYILKELVKKMVYCLLKKEQL